MIGCTFQALSSPRRPSITAFALSERAVPGQEDPYGEQEAADRGDQLAPLQAGQIHPRGSLYGDRGSAYGLGDVLVDAAVEHVGHELGLLGQLGDRPRGGELHRAS